MKNNNTHMKPIANSIRQRVLKGLIICCSASMLTLGAQEAPVVELAEETLKGKEGLEIRPSSLPDIVSAASLQSEEFRKYPSQRNLGDIIARLPGVAMGGPPNSNKDITLRGLDKNFNRFEIDGVQIPGTDKERSVSMERFSSLLAGEVSVLRAPTAEYEADGIAGKILVETREVPDAFEMEYKAGFGGSGEPTGSTSFSDIDGDYLTGELYLGGPLNEQWGVNAVIAYTENAFQKVDDETKDKTKFTDDTKTVIDEFEEEEKLKDEVKPQERINLFVNLEYKYDTGKFNIKPMLANFAEPKDKIELTTKEKFESDGSLKETEEIAKTEDESKDKDTKGIILENEHQLDRYDARVESLFSYFNTTEEKLKSKVEKAEKFDENGVPGDTKEKLEDEVEDKDDESVEFRSKLIAEHNFMDMPNEFRTGFHIRFKDRDATKQKTKTEFKNGVFDKREDEFEADGNFELEEDVYAGFAQNEFKITPKFSIMPGVRVEHTDFSSTDLGSGNAQDKTFTDVLPNLNLFYQYNEQISFTASVTRSLNRPNFNQLSPFETIDDEIVQGNPDLDPARSWNFDAGVTFEKEKLYLAANIFHKEIEDVVELSDTGNDRLEGGDLLDISRFENVGDGYLQGIELEQRYNAESFIPGLTLWANQTFLDSELTDASGLDRPFNKQPDLIANLGFDYTLAQTGTTVSLAARFRDDASEVEREAGETEFETEESLWILDLSVRQPINENMSLVFQAVNFTNQRKERNSRKVKSEEVEIERRIEEPGRFFSLAVEGKF